MYIKMLYKGFRQNRIGEYNKNLINLNLTEFKY